METVNRDTGIPHEQVRNYFVKLGLQLKNPLRLHKAAGLWDRIPKSSQVGLKEWGNVSEHCLVEAARVAVFSTWLGFSRDLREDLIHAAALHDYFKKREKEMTRQEGNTEVSYDSAERESYRLLTEAGFSPRVIYLTDATGTVESVRTRTPQILNEQELSEDDIAYLVMHYVDDYTRGADWAIPVEQQQDRMVNDFDRRMDDLEKRYPELREEGFLELQRGIGYQVEQRLADLISQRTGLNINPKKMPEMVDEEIRKKIIQASP